MRFSGMTGMFSAACVLFVGAQAKDIVITVGRNTTNNVTAVFEPRSVTAKLNDVVVFNFTTGNHTAIEAAFYAPCVPNADRNGFNSGVHVEQNGSAGSILTVPITPDIENKPLFFYDDSLCNQGGVGVINENSTSGETLDGFERNAKRLYGATTTSSSHSQTASPSASSGDGGDDTDAAMHVVMLSGASVVPMLMLALGSLLI